MENKLYMNEKQFPIERVCPKCGGVLKLEWNACPSCGWTMMQENKVSHGAAVASIVCGILGLFFFGIILGSIGAAAGAQAIKNKDKWGYAGLVLGIMVVIFSIISIIDLFSQLYYY
jgi:hypothetical protein